MTEIDHRVRAAWNEYEFVLFEGARPVTEVELDRLLDVARTSPQHGLISAAAIPSSRRISHEVVVPDVLPVLVRSSFLRLSGGLDVHLDGVIPALADLGLRLNPAGVSTVVADAVGTSDAPVDWSGATLAAIRSRHPRVDEFLERWRSQRSTPEERFRPLLDHDRTSPRRVLLDVSTLDPIANGSARAALSALEGLCARLTPRGYHVELLANEAAADRFGLQRLGVVVRYPSNIGADVFDVGVAIAPISTPEQAERLDRVALRWVAVHLDVIALRIHALRALQPDRISTVLSTVQLADRVVTISEASNQDLRALLGGAPPAPIIVAHQGVSDAAMDGEGTAGSESGLTPEIRTEVERGGFVLLSGNGHPHKQVATALEALAGLDVPIISPVGSLTAGSATAARHVLPSGGLSDKLMDELYASAGAMVFPSTYEGFGLPVVEAAAYGLPVVAFASAAVKEVAAALDLMGEIEWFDDFSELGNSVRRALARGRTAPRAVKDMSGYVEALEGVVVEIAEEPPRVSDNAAERCEHFRSIRAATDRTAARLSACELRLSEMTDLSARLDAEREAAVHAAVEERRARDEIEAQREDTRSEAEQLRAQLAEVRSSRAYRVARAMGDLRGRLINRRR